jgi:hypothetical protein
MTASVYAGLVVASLNSEGLSTAVLDRLTTSGSVSPAANFSISVSPATATIAAGDSGDFKVSTVAMNSFASAVNLNVTGIPPNSHFTFLPATIQGPGSSDLTIFTSPGTPQGTYPITVAGTSGTLTQSVSFALTVGPPIVIYGVGTAIDIGGPSLPGNTSITNSSYAVTGSGRDIWGTLDQFQFQNWRLDGDGTITAQLLSFSGLNANSKAGIMIRETNAAGAPYAFVRFSPGNARLDYRLASTTNSTNGVSAASLTPNWVRLSRSGQVFTGYFSADGVNWRDLGSQTISMGSSTLVGFAVSSHDNTRLETAVLDRLSITGAVTLTPEFSLSTDLQTGSVTIGGGSTSWQVTAESFNGFNAPLNLTVTGLPSNVSATFNPPSPVGSQPSTLTLVVGASVPEGSYPFTLSATSGTLTRTVPLMLSVTAQ